MHIKEVAKQLNTTPRSIRFYEEKGLISPKKDTENDYRYFTENDLLRLSTILTLREIGMGVKDIKKLLENPDMGMKQYLNVQRAALFEQWLEMKDMIRTIDKMLDQTFDQAEDEGFSIDYMHNLGRHLKRMKDIRTNWQDRWNFDQQASTYDNSIRKEGYSFNIHQDYDEALARVVDTIQLQSGDTILDIGIGTGNLGSRFLEKGLHVIGVDQSENMLQVCKEKHPEIETRKGHFLALPLMDNHVEGIVSSYALHHLPDEEKLLALEEMTRVLKHGGQICIADLMFVDEEQRMKAMEHFRETGNTEAIDSIEDEFFADQSLLVKWLMEHNYKVETHQFNDFLGMVYASRN